MLIYKFLGSGGVMPLPKRYLTSIFIQSGATQFLIDCGEGTQMAASTASIKLFNIDAVFITHFHADHILGLPGLIASLSNNGREKPLFVYGPPDVNAYVTSMLRIISRPTFPIVPVEIKGDMEIKFSDITVKAFGVQHSVPCFGYSFEVSRKPEYKQEVVDRFNLTRAEVTALQNGYTLERNNLVLDVNNLFGENRESIKLVYSTDTGYCRNLIKNCKDATTVILDASYADESQIAKSNDKIADIHMTFKQAAMVAKEANAQQLILTHFSPIIADPTKCLDNARCIFPNTLCAFTGMINEVMYEQNSRNNGIPTIEVKPSVIRDVMTNSASFVIVPNQEILVDTCYLTADGLPDILVSVEQQRYFDDGSICSSSTQQSSLIFYARLIQVLNS